MMVTAPNAPFAFSQVHFSDCMHQLAWLKDDDVQTKQAPTAYLLIIMKKG